MAVKIFKVEISNRRGKSYKVEDKRPLLDSLKEQGCLLYTSDAADE